jgi:citrate synthase
MYEAVCKTMGNSWLLQLGHTEKSMGYPLNYYDNTKGM